MRVLGLIDRAQRRQLLHDGAFAAKSGQRHATADHLAQHRDVGREARQRFGVDRLRAAQRNGVVLPAEAVQETALAQALTDRLAAAFSPSLRRVFNLTGTVLHTNLGRALLPAEAVAAE